MGVVTRQMLNRHMSEPRWTTAQEADAERLCVAVEMELSGALYGAQITPVLRSEVVQVSREGMVTTSLPVAAVVSLNGTPVAEAPEGQAQVLPAGYTLREHWLYLSQAGVETMTWPSPVRTFDPYAREASYTGYSVAVQYMGGWGADPALVEAILRKAKVRMSGAHSDTIVITGLNSAPANGQSRESPNFTEDDLRALGRFRNLGWA